MGAHSQRKSAFYEAVWELARKIPPGKVVTYGQLAAFLGRPRSARAVGYAMFCVEDESLPWHRVVNAQGRISIGGHQHRPALQRKRLECEGVLFSDSGRIDLSQYGWFPPISIL